MSASSACLPAPAHTASVRRYHRCNQTFDYVQLGKGVYLLHNSSTSSDVLLHRWQGWTDAVCAGAGRQAELAYKGFSLAGYRAGAADPRYRIVPPVYAALTSNNEHTACCGPRTRVRVARRERPGLPHAFSLV